MWHPSSTGIKSTSLGDANTFLGHRKDLEEDKTLTITSNATNICCSYSSWSAMKKLVGPDNGDARSLMGGNVSHDKLLWSSRCRDNYNNRNSGSSYRKEESTFEIYGWPRWRLRNLFDLLCVPARLSKNSFKGFNNNGKRSGCGSVASAATNKFASFAFNKHCVV